MKRARTVALPRPKGTRASSRVALTITMHPRDLLDLERRAERASMSLRAYIVALLESDADDLPSRTKAARARINWLETKEIGELLAKRCMVPCPLPCTRPEGHEGEHDCDYLRPERFAEGAIYDECLRNAWRRRSQRDRLAPGPERFEEGAICDECGGTHGGVHDRECSLRGPTA